MSDPMAMEDDPVAAYKALLRELINRRPSGTRQKIAEAIGTHKSFVSQITNPALRVPLPAQHVPTLIRVCHFSQEEQDQFLELYARAHPNQVGAIEDLAGMDRDILRIPLPNFEDEALRREVTEIIWEFAERVIGLAQSGRDKNRGGRS